jgi:hypothetical protein
MPLNQLPMARDRLLQRQPQYSLFPQFRRDGLLREQLVVRKNHSPARFSQPAAPFNQFRPIFIDHIRRARKAIKCHRLHVGKAPRFVGALGQGGGRKLIPRRLLAGAKVRGMVGEIGSLEVGGVGGQVWWSWLQSGHGLLRWISQALFKSRG